ncbi:MAG: hypothetical protein GEV11_00820 [Streptosporangiales bacterium]|nr:hypothetical protein [Streptosporangiales bacterium]
MDEMSSLPRGQEARALILAAEWLGVATLDSLEALRSFRRWSDLLSAGSHHMGEATIFTLCELRSGMAVVDDRKARNIGRREGIAVTGTLGLLGEACDAGRLSWPGAGGMLDALRATGARFPCSGSDFRDWYAAQSLMA